jgi:succinate dehydrogenase hydrophobic anchor subunit
VSDPDPDLDPAPDAGPPAADAGAVVRVPVRAGAGATADDVLADDAEHALADDAEHALADDAEHPLADLDVAAPRRAGRLAGIAAFAYVCWYIAGLVVLDVSPSAYNALNRFYGSLGFRVVLAGVLLALVFHLIDGLRVTVEDLIPGWDRHDLLLRTITGFLVPVVWIPAALVVVWPAVRGWFSW